MEIIKEIIIFLCGIVGGYFTHLFQIRSDKSKLVRERFLNEIVKIEEFIQLIDDIYFISKKLALLEQNGLRINQQLENAEKLFGLLRNEYEKKKKNHNKREANELLIQSQELQKSLEKMLSDLEENKTQLIGLELINTSQREEIEKHDFVVSAVMIDPSGKLTLLLVELLKMVSTKGLNPIYDTKDIQIKVKIKKLLNEKILKGQ